MRAWVRVWWALAVVVLEVLVATVAMVAVQAAVLEPVAQCDAAGRRVAEE